MSDDSWRGLIVAGTAVAVTLSMQLYNRWSVQPISQAIEPAPLDQTPPLELTPNNQNNDDSILDEALDNVLSIEEDELFYDYREVTPEEEALYGFERPDFQKFRQNVVLDYEDQSKKMGQVEDEGTRLAYHDKHVFVLTNQRATEWEERVDKTGFAKEVNSAMNKHRKDLKVKVSVAEALLKDDISQEQDVFDILVLPDRRRYRHVKKEDLADVASSIAKGTTPANISVSTLKEETSIFVCCHAKRHLNIQTCGPRIFKKITQSAPSSVAVRRVSDLGGLSHETNLIIFNRSKTMNKWFGDWYWNVGLNDVDELLSKIGTDRIMLDRWRGRCGLKASTVNSFLKFQTINTINSGI
ncbi:hypothetical protein AKO1_007680 [Acrasis kona]|uniref:Uncharacterized protein n=1 Tax=Acrasis kona TaxID=1008807 RepID=A0AAW2YTC0_9EUKA